jgi:hypothetical protein
MGSFNPMAGMGGGTVPKQSGGNGNSTERREQPPID